MTRREEQRGQAAPFLERNLLLRQSAGRFEKVTATAFERLGIHRGAAFGDIDNDGDTDIVISVNNGQARLLRNTSPARNWVAVAAPVGSRVELKSPGLPRQVRYVRTDSSYLSASDPRVLFAVRERVESLVVAVPGRAAQTFVPPLNQLFRVP